jgi:hypothetical protein
MAFSFFSTLTLALISSLATSAQSPQPHTLALPRLMRDLRAAYAIWPNSHGNRWRWHAAPQTPGDRASVFVDRHWQSRPVPNARQ